MSYERDEAMRQQEATEAMIRMREPRQTGPHPDPLTADFTRTFPGGKMDDSDYEAIETALDRAGAPCQASDGRWLNLPERIDRQARDRQALIDALKAAKSQMWIDARSSWTMADFKNWAVIQQIDAALTNADGVAR